MEVQEVIELMQNLDIPDELIPSLVMTAYFESGLNQNVININREEDGTITEDRSYLQLNIDKFFFEDGTPDETIKTYFKKIKKPIPSKSEFEKLISASEKEATRFAAHYIKRLSNNPNSFRTGGKPLRRWSTYRDYVEPFELTGVLGNPDELDKVKQQRGLEAYILSSIIVNNNKLKKDILKRYPNILRRTDPAELAEANRRVQERNNG
jgi:hypothetical protein|tara:strand:+ start:5142 stop:5768 length:627 start_codon:yes stop_codon:yes gene_type:complete